MATRKKQREYMKRFLDAHPGYAAAASRKFRAAMTPEQKKAESDYKKRWSKENWKRVKRAKKKWRMANPEILRRMGRNRMRRLRAWIQQFKISSGGCVDCGYNRNPAALDFDHVRGTKKINVGRVKSMAAAKAEIAKCVVRCRNCHSERTFPHLTRHASSTS